MRQSGGINYYRADLDATNTKTGILPLSPKRSCSVTIKPGATESLSLYASNAPHDDIAENAEAEMMLIADNIEDDYYEVFLGTVTAVQVVGNTTNDSWVRVLQEERHA
jgi:hypothetical protein